MLGASLERAGTGGQPRCDSLFPAQGTVSPLPPPAPTLAEHLLAGQTGLGRRKEGSPEGSSGGNLGWGERRRVLTVKELMEQSRLDRTQVHAAPASSHLLFHIGAVTLAEDTTACLPVMHGHVGSHCSGCEESPCSALGTCGHRTGDREPRQPKRGKPCFSGQYERDWLGSSGATTQHRGGVIFATLLLMAEVSLFSRCLS